MKVFKAPNINEENRALKIFLAGSISGKDGLGSMSEDWQTRVTNALSEYDVEIYNPRRDDWDSTWEQDPTRGTQFHEQVNWELDHIEDADLVVFYFDPETKSPITLAELGLVLGLGKEILVYCPKEFYRYGNVAILVDKYNDQKNLFIDESEWMAEIEMLISDNKIETEMEEETQDSENAEVVLEDTTPKIAILFESANSDFEHYISDKYNIKE